jgi:hypothetical protein
VVIGAPGLLGLTPACSTPARTLEGMHAKIAFASKFDFGEREDLVEGTAEDLLLSAAMDYADLHGREVRS